MAPSTRCRYASRVLIEPHRTELVADLDVPVKELLVTFYQQNRGVKPEAIVFFRDGVSEGEYDQVGRAGSSASYAVSVVCV
jgi:hypothetical protein